MFLFIVIFSFDRTHSIREKINMVQEQDEQYLKEWEQIVVKIDDWFSKAENEAIDFDKAKQDILSLEDQVGRHEV